MQLYDLYNRSCGCSLSPCTRSVGYFNDEIHVTIVLKSSLDQLSLLLIENN